MPTVRKRRKDHRPAEITRAAIEAFADKGYIGTKVTDVAHRANVSKGTVYHYFGDKNALFRAAFHTCFVDSLQPVTLPPIDGSANMTSLLEYLLREAFLGLQGSEASSLLKVILIEGDRFPDLVLQCQSDLLNKIEAPLMQLIDAGILSGEFGPGAYRDMPSIMLLPGVMLSLLGHFFSDDRDIDVFDAFLDLIINGLLKRP
ncbi:TetR/AcrR family transcriptional regulator [Gymnodinialimonas hymeniacidonis]|uniref:TetR/AcrR family transcriptional regulator n=1 Tax=Gymnodinialimonas hymeniacidonis TaxID=3126508 RepID=UPI0034C63A21